MEPFLSGEVLCPGGNNGGLIHGDNGAVGVGHQAAVGGPCNGVGGVPVVAAVGGGVGSHQTVGGEVVGPSSGYGGLISRDDGAVGVGDQGGVVKGGGSVDVVSGGVGDGSSRGGVAVGGEMFGTGGGYGGLIGGYNGAIGMRDEGGVVERAGVGGGVHVGVLGSGVGGRNSGDGVQRSVLGGDVLGFGGSDGWLVQRDDGTVGVGHQPVESLGSGGDGGSADKENLNTTQVTDGTL